MLDHLHLHHDSTYHVQNWNIVQSSSNLQRVKRGKMLRIMQISIRNERKMK